MGSASNAETDGAPRFRSRCTYSRAQRSRASRSASVSPCYRAYGQHTGLGRASWTARWRTFDHGHQRSRHAQLPHEGPPHGIRHRQDQREGQPDAFAELQGGPRGRAVGVQRNPPQLIRRWCRHSRFRTSTLRLATRTFARITVSNRQSPLSLSMTCWAPSLSLARPSRPRRYRLTLIRCYASSGVNSKWSSDKPRRI